MNDLGPNQEILAQTVDSLGSDRMFVDLGVRSGESSMMMIANASARNNRVHGVDIDSAQVPSYLTNHERYAFILGDSVTIGKHWNKGSIDLLFIDTCHIKEQVLCELFFWFPHIREGGYVVFHDTAWPKDKHDMYGGIVWERPEEAVKAFFGISSLDQKTEFVESKHYPESWGMTFVQVKKQFSPQQNFKDWQATFEKRNHLLDILSKTIRLPEFEKL
jgi:cephalosporin hydroxylase